MPVLMRSMQYLFAPIAITFLCIAVTQQLASTWQAWLPKIDELPYYVFGVSALLALQFNFSRVSYLSLLLLLFYYLIQTDSQSSAQAIFNREQILIIGTFIITFFAISKDRALFSLHFIKMIFGVALCFILALGWYATISKLTDLDAKQLLPSSLHLLLSLYVPVGIACIVVCIFVVWRSTGVDSTIALTLFVWLFYYYLPNELPLSILLSLLAIAYLCSIVVESYHLAYKDDLTGLSSRRALNTMALSLNKHYSLAMIDIDHFKTFNDTYGHDIGDQVLRLVARKLSKVKGGGQVFRYGGEEFTIVFENKDIEVVLPHLEDLRRKISDYNIVLRNEGRKASSKSDRTAKDKANPIVNITISIGVAEQRGETTFENTLKRADKALYQAKNNGRNQVFA
ncbi:MULTISPECIES: GGDEF domain-containing protein [unclassified Shewanella]|uniref:GGDEF domain-containing protein n=1 Tax=unclassified Shewanella TaxID=196818 RepID=UPI001C7DA913|nr:MULTISPECIES: GGDEF domain-containing protein [unclassified Shewanella]